MVGTFTLEHVETTKEYFFLLFAICHLLMFLWQSSQSLILGLVHDQLRAYFGFQAQGLLAESPSQALCQLSLPAILLYVIFQFGQILK